MVDWLFWMFFGLFGGLALPFAGSGSGGAVAVEPAATSSTVVASPAVPPSPVEQSPAVPGTVPEGQTSATGPAHQQWLDREPLPSCGGIAAGGSGSWQKGRAFDCLRQAATRGRAAELVVWFGGEGQVLGRWYRVTADSLLEIYTQHSLGWEWVQCPLPRELADGCTGAEWTLTTP